MNIKGVGDNVALNAYLRALSGTHTRHGIHNATTGTTYFSLLRLSPINKLKLSLFWWNSIPSSLIINALNTQSPSTGITMPTGRSATATAAAEYPPRLSLGEKVKLYSTATRIASTTCLTHGIGGVFRGKPGARSFRAHLAHAMIRRLSDTLSDREYQYVLPTPYSPGTLEVVAHC